MIVSRFADVGGIRTHYLDGGDGPPLVLLHSGEFGASAELTWEHNLEGLAEHFRVIAPDWLGFGQTDKLYDFGSGSERRMRHLVAFLETLAIDRAHFAGVSMGGTALIREAAAPACRLPIERMVISSGGGFVPDNDARRRLLDYDGTPDAMRALLRANFSDPRWAEDDSYVARRVAASLAPGAWEVVNAARLKAPNVPPRSGFGAPDTVAYERIRVPTLLLVGEEDQLREPGYHLPLAERIPDVRAVVVPGAGHLHNIERADVFNREALAFLGGLVEAVR
jgi:2-hydroxymuconate-semialdehyde hydrolase